MKVHTLEEKLDPRHSALLIVDVQNAFCHPKGLRGNAPNFNLIALEAMKANLLALLAAARKTGVLRVFIRAIHDEVYVSGPYAEKLYQQRTLGKITLGSWEADYWGQELQPKPGAKEAEVLKHRYTAFHGTNLNVILRSNGVKTIIVTGVAASGCVMATAMDGFFNDYFVVLATDAVADRDKEAHQVFERRLKASWGDCATTKEITRLWKAAR